MFLALFRNNIKISRRAHLHAKSGLIIQLILKYLGQGGTVTKKELSSRIIKITLLLSERSFFYKNNDVLLTNN
jgi:hypothetical protein